jgi:uncharacterized membrane protein YphA (DoxX/SURF4 family)
MKKRNKIIYWIATIWLALGLISTGIVQLLKIESETAFILQLGYPAYLLTLIGLWKILGAIAVLIPKTALIKEWAYAGIFFNMTGAIFSHIAADSAKEIFPSLLIVTLAALSWYFRPSDRKINFAQQVA